MGTAIEQGSRTTGGARDGRGGYAHTDGPRAATKRTYQQIADSDRGTGGESLANFLGWFSVGLGMAEALAPRAMSRGVGVDPDENSGGMRAMGLREIGHGLAILTNQQPTKALWARVAGDALDLALLGKALSNPDNGRGRTMFATANVLAVTALDIIAAKELSKQPTTEATRIMDQGLVRRKAGVTVNRPVEEVYGFWHNFENFPQ